MAIKKLTSFAAYDSTQTRQRALSIMKPTVTRTRQASHDPTVKMAPNFFNSPAPGEFKKPADLLHELKLMQLRDEA